MVTFVRGEKHQLGAGRWEGRLRNADFRRLTELIHSLGFFALESQYRGRGSHGQVVTITAIRDSKPKEVTDFKDAAPATAWGLAKVIRSLRGDIRWKPNGTGGVSPRW